MTWWVTFSAFPPRIGLFSPRWPRIVAEALREVAQPVASRELRTAVASADTLGALIRASRAAPCSGARPPAWLLTHQVEAWRRVVAAIERFDSALLIEDVGRGKTWIALAVAHHLATPAIVIAPAILQAQWRDAAGRIGVPLEFHSHERLSRGSLPPARNGLAIIDEAHRFRTPATRRVRTIAPWLTGRQALLCTATPIVNTARDLCALLDLVVADDALALDGIPSLAALSAHVEPPDALDRLVVRTCRVEHAAPSRQLPLAPGSAEQERAMRGLADIDQLVLSRHADVARLVRVTLTDALASSDAAFAASLRQYRAILLHARDAGGAPRRILRQFAGPAMDQMALWSLLDGCDDDGDLALDDLPRLDAVLTGHRAADEAWIAPLRAALHDDIPTVCFTRHHATARVLRTSVGEATAWVTGAAAGIGSTRMARSQVLAAFGPARPGWRVLRVPPNLLIATDVAAEGLDLQAAGRIVHVDVPWTDMRIRQREGRLTRPGQRHREVVVLTRQPPRSIEHRLASQARVRRKATCRPMAGSARANGTASRRCNRHPRYRHSADR